MASLTVENWLRFFVWLLIGLVVYHFMGASTASSPPAKLRPLTPEGRRELMPPVAA